MLRIVRSGFSSGARDAFCNSIKRLSSQGKRSYLIVPEQQTVMAEALMSSLLPPSSVLCFEVTNFTRFANTTFRALGGLGGEYCDSAKKSLIMWRALTELSPVLTMTAGRREINAGLVDSALSAVAEMQSYGISPMALAEISANGSVKFDNRLKSKITDLASIYSLYKNLLGKKYADSGDDAEAMIRKLSENPTFLSDTEIFVEGFTSFTEPQYRLIGLLCARTSVSVALTLPKGREEAYEFLEISRCIERLVSSARKHGAEIKLSREEGIKKSSESLSLICDGLWSTITPNEKISLQNDDELRIFEAETPYDECAFICDDIKRRVMGGASYSDFAIIARKDETYSGILDTALLGADIPIFSSLRKDVQEFEAIKLIYTAYSVCRGFRREDVISYAKCALSGVSREECDEFEMYVNTWQISGRGFTDGEVWNMNPAGYTVRRPDGMDEKLLRIHNVRTRIIDPLYRFAKEVSEAKTIVEQATCLVSFLTAIDMEASLKKRAERLMEMGESDLAKDNLSLWSVICSALDTLVEVLGDLPTDTDTFLSQLKVVFSSADIGRIPSYTDRVTVGNADMLRLYEKPYVYLIGVNSGAFPATVSERSYFSERDRRLLLDLGLTIYPELEVKGARELYIFSRAFSYATRGVTISYSASDNRFKAIEPAEVVSRISTLTGGEVPAVKISSISKINRLYSASNALNFIDEGDEDYSVIRDALIKSGHQKKLEICEGNISNTSSVLGAEVVKEYNDKAISLTQSRIDSYVNCPFSYFCRYTVKLSKDERAEFDARSIGSFIHGILENFFAALSREGRKSGDLTADERRDLTIAAAKKYIAELGEDIIDTSVKTRIKIDRLCRAALPVVDGLCDEFRESAFEPRFFELSLGYESDTPDPITIKSDSGDIKIYGIIDRVDAYKRGEDVYLRVVDYKSGHKEFSPEDIAEGSNLQMFLYLRALVDSEKAEFKKRVGVSNEGRILPAGVIYVKTSVRDVRVDLPDDDLAQSAVKSAQAREGMILNDPDNISAMTLKYTPVYSKRTPDKIPDAKQKFLYTEDGWNEIMQTVEGAVCQVADGIRKGEISATPNEQKGKSPCDFCDFRPICRRP